jgi:drug/metabolite transporter (DMT)-like permease
VGDRKTVSLALGTLLFWSSAFAGIRAGLKGLSPGHLVLLRYVIASLVLFVWHRVAKLPWPPRRLWGRLAVLGLVGIGLYQIALTFGERAVPAGTASFIIATSPAFTALMASRWLGEQLHWRGWVGLGLSLAGVAVLTLTGQGTGFRADALFILLAAVATSAFFVGEKPLLDTFPASAVTAWVTWAGTLPMLVFLPGLGRAIQGAPASVLAAVAYLGVLPAGVAYVLWAAALQRGQASRVSAWLFLNPVLATLVAWVWLGETPGLSLAVGGTLALLGVVLVQKSPAGGEDSGPPTGPSRAPAPEPSMGPREGGGGPR